MSKSKKMLLRIIPVVLVLMVVVVPNIFGFADFDQNKFTGDLSGNQSIGVADNAVKRIWGTVSLILQVCAVAAIVLAGVRYMFASADGKADIKKQTVGLIVGAILVFGASTVVSLIVDVTNGVAGK